MTAKPVCGECDEPYETPEGYMDIGVCQACLQHIAAEKAAAATSPICTFCGAAVVHEPYPRRWGCGTQGGFFNHLFRSEACYRATGEWEREQEIRAEVKAIYAQQQG
jgi:hypothetical protein